jgi:hypothetical protein
MVVSRPMEDPASVVVSLDVRRAQLRRRRRLVALREWAGLAAVAVVGVWLLSLGLLALLGH